MKQFSLYVCLVLVCVLVGCRNVPMRPTDPPPPTQTPIPPTETPLPPVAYENRLGFSIDLPDSWRGFSVEEGQWQGVELATGDQNMVTRGIQWEIIHPLSTEDVPHQNIPIMVFTPEQWAEIEQERMITSAAPVSPGELGRNSAYIFALPPRYNFVEKKGIQDVVDILAGDNFHTFEPSSS